MQDFLGWVESSAPEREVPVLWEEGPRGLSPVGRAMHQLLVVQAFRPDRVIAQGHQVVASVLGPDFMTAAETELDLAAAVDNEARIPFTTARSRASSCVQKILEMDCIQ